MATPRGGGGARGQNLEHLVKVVFLCWSFLEVYIFATTYRKAFIVGPKVPYPTLPVLSPPHPTPALPRPASTLPLPTLPLLTHTPPTLPYPYLHIPLLPYPALPCPALPRPAPPHPHPYPTLPSKNSNTCTYPSHSRATLSCDSSYFYIIGRCSHFVKHSHEGAVAQW